MFTFTTSGSFGKTESFLKKMRSRDIYKVLDSLGKEGVKALRESTPADSGLSALSWTYRVKMRRKLGPTIVWNNTNLTNGTPVVILIEYGHATRDGGWVEGRPFINEAIQPIFDKIATQVWREVQRA